MSLNAEKILEVVRSYVGQLNPKLAPNISMETRLLQDGYLDSFALVQLITELEKVLDMQLGDGALLPEDFESPAALVQRLNELQD